MSEHTPGPWELHSEGVQGWHSGVQALAVWKETAHWSYAPIAWVHPYLHLGDPVADARLIAAAPDLLAAAKAVVEHNDSVFGGTSYELLIAAIAKAESP